MMTAHSCAQAEDDSVTKRSGFMRRGFRSVGKMEISESSGTRAAVLRPEVTQQDINPLIFQN